MTQPGTLQFDNNSFAFEETTICGIYEPYGYMTWEIGLYPSGEDNYIMFNSLILENVFSPQQLSGIAYQATDSSSDLYEHTVRVNGEDRFLQSVDMRFGEWDTVTQTIELSGRGLIIKENNLLAVVYQFDALLKCQHLNIFETTEEDTQAFVDKYFQDDKDRLDVNFENVASGLHAIITVRF